MLSGEIFVKHLNVIIEAIIYHIKTSHMWLAISYLHFTKGLILNYKQFLVGYSGELVKILQDFAMIKEEDYKI